MKSLKSFEGILNLIPAIIGVFLIIYFFNLTWTENKILIILLGLLCIPWKFGKNLYSIFGGLNSSGNVYSITPFYQRAENDAGCIFGIPFYQRAGNDAGLMIGFSFWQYAKENTFYGFGFSLIQHGKNIGQSFSKKENIAVKWWGEK